MKHFRSLKIAPKLTLVIGSFAFLLLANLGLLSYFNGRSAIQAATERDLSSTAVEKQAALESWIEETRSDVAIIASTYSVTESVNALVSAQPGSSGQAEAYQLAVAEMQYWVSSEEAFTSMFLLDPVMGRVIASTDPWEQGEVRADRPYFIEGQKGPYLQEPYYSPSVQSLLMTASAPVHTVDGELLAVLAGHVDINYLNSIVTRSTGGEQTLDSYLVNTSHLFVTQPRFIEENVVFQRKVLTDAVDRCLARESGVVVADDYRGTPVMAAYRWMPKQELCLVVKIDQAQSLKPLSDFGQSMLIIGGVTLVIAIVLASGLARSITQPVDELMKGTQAFGRGELDYHIPGKGSDEIGQLASMLNEMAGQRKRAELELQAHRDNLEELVMERTAELTRSNKELEQFAYVASHDLQEPLRMVTSYMQLIERRYKGKLDADADEFIDYAVDGANRMKRLINDLLAYSRVGTRGKELVPTDSQAILESVLDSLQIAIENTGGRVTNDPLPPVLADEGQLAQLFQNLIENALKFHKEKVPPWVHIAILPPLPNPSEGSLHVEGQGGRNNMLTFSFRDNGIGFDSQYSERIFVIFERLHTREQYGGTGIGLAICKKIVERHGGRIWVESIPGEGSTFYFTLLAAQDKAPLESPSPII